jgi:hypothetical protein
MKPIGYFLILLLLSAQLDDAWAAPPVLPSAPLGDDNDEYPPAQRRAEEEESSPRQQPVFNGLKPHIAALSFVARDVAVTWNLPTPLGPSLLSLFMILQI